jgi:hypothetical protein
MNRNFLTMESKKIYNLIHRLLILFYHFYLLFSDCKINEPSLLEPLGPGVIILLIVLNISNLNFSSISCIPLLFLKERLLNLFLFSFII